MTIHQLTPNETIAEEKDLLKINLADLPYFRALLRAVESRFYLDINLMNPVLDLGCGDGHFSKVTFSKVQLIGIDPQWLSIREAQKTSSYQYLIDSSGMKLPFRNGTFNSCISNSVLEHIPEIDNVIQEVARVLNPGGLFIFCVPNESFTKHLSIAKFFEKIHLLNLADLYRKFFNKISRHYHCDSFVVWQKRLISANFRILDHWDYFSPAALRCMEWGHYFGLPYWISKKIFGKWVLCPFINQTVVYKIIKKYCLYNSKSAEGAYSFYITCKN